MMRETSLEYPKIPYRVDLENSQVFRMDGLNLIEINNPEILRRLRLESTEISANDARRLSGGGIN